MVMLTTKNFKTKSDFTLGPNTKDIPKLNDSTSRK